MIYPEFCKYTERYDHNLDIDQLHEQYRLRGAAIFGGKKG